MNKTEEILEKGNYILDCDIENVLIDEHNRPYTIIHDCKVYLSKRNT